MTESKYSELGASSSKAGIHSALEALNLTPSTDYFCKINDDIAGDSSYCSFVHGDGAGTKSIVAYLHYRETGDASAFRSLAQDSLVMNLDDILCLGKPSALALSNAIARNFKLIPDAVIQEIIAGYKEVIDLLRAHNIPIELSGGETADVGDVVRTVLIDSTISGRMPRRNLINLSAIRAGDVIVGLASFGKSQYESVENSGIGSNGLTLARHVLLKNDYAKRFPEVVAQESDPLTVYQGPFALKDQPTGLSMTVGQALLSPTRTYAPILWQLYDELGPELHGAIHLTGGAHSKVLRFGNKLTIEKSDLFPAPRIFSLIQEEGDVSFEEMYKVFNMGSRLELTVPEKSAETVIRAARNFGVGAQAVGRVVSAGEKARISLQTPEGTISYSLAEA